MYRGKNCPRRAVHHWRLTDTMLERSAPLTATTAEALRIRTLTDLVLGFPETRAGETALVFLGSRGDETSRLTHAELAETAKRAASVLSGHGAPGTPIMLAVEDQAAFVASFFGAVLAGLVPAPIAPVRRRKHSPTFLHLAHVARADGISCVVTGPDDADWLREALAGEGLSHVKVLDTTSLETGDADFTPHEPTPSDLAYLQYTSGSTSAPKGVRLTHANVAAHLDLMYQTFNREAPVRVAGWLPLHHDMGLVGHLFTVLYEHAFGVLLPPKAFLARPELWLRAVETYEANSAATPTFALQHCVDRINEATHFDLSTWRQIFVGSETVSPQTLKRFAERFGPSGLRADALRPVYGLAEATLLASGGRASWPDLTSLTRSGPRGRALLGYPVNDGLELRITSPTGTDLPNGEAGEILIAGASVSGGYFGDKDSKSGIWRATGDLGYIHDGALYITGRLKDTIVIRGRNLAAEDLEHAAASGLGDIGTEDRTACVGKICAEGEQLIVFQEASRHSSFAARKRIVDEIQANLLDAFGIAPEEVVLVPTGLLPRTPNNKLARRTCLEALASGDLRILPVAPTTPISGTPEGTDPVVVVGMACRFPGATEPETFWNNLCSGVDSITEVPPERWDNAVFYDETAAVPGKVNTKCAGFLDGIALFDPDLFGISHFEANEVDPQQRLLLEMSWRLIEDCGWKKDQLSQSATGVFVGISTNDYLYSKIKLTPGMVGFNAYSGLGNANSVAANRLSYFYDLRGPSMAVDTACSSSLTAFHLGAQAILSGECDQAIVGGVNAILSPGPTITLSQFGMMAPDGRCKAFDASADGYVRSEGCGLVMLKRRSRALADGDRILAVLDASVAGQDGASPGMTYPNGAAQHALIERALAQAGLDGASVGYVEAHGTGTAAGDPVEVAELKRLYGQGSENCHLGSVKANIGHLEAAAGIASVIKVLLMLQHGKVPPQIHIKTLNPGLALDNTRLGIAQDLVDWPQPASGTRRAAISSFGFGGSLAHVILHAPTKALAATENETPRADFTRQFPQPLVISAHTPEALEAQTRDVADWLRGMPPLSHLDACHSLAACRSDLRYRRVVLAHSRLSAAEALDVARAVEPAGRGLSSCFLFTGQGEHYLHMGRELYMRYPAFKHDFDRCADALDLLDQPFTLADLAFQLEDTSLWNDRFMQPILFAVQYALARLYISAGVVPRTVIGHSLGEYAAACIAGALTPEDAMRILYRRGALIEELSPDGHMAAVMAPVDAVADALDPSLAQIAAINSPTKCVISGHPAEVDRVMQLFVDQGYGARHLITGHPYHSALLDPTLDAFAAELQNYEFRAPDRTWISSMTAKTVTEAPGPEHWVRHLRQSVLFHDALAGLDPADHDAFIEIGPGAGCIASARETVGRKDAAYLRSLNFKKGERTELHFFLDTMSKLYERGALVNWPQLIGGVARPEILPPLQFQRRRCWIEGLSAENFTAFATGAEPVVAPPATIKDDTDQSALHHLIEWQDAGEIHPVGARETGRQFNWLIVGEATARTSKLLAEVRERGDDVFWVCLGTTDPTLRQRPAARLAQDADVGAWKSALARILDLQSRAGATNWKVLFLGTDCEVETADVDDVESATARDMGALVPMLQAMRDCALVCPLWLLTEAAHQISQGAAINPMAATLWGFGRTLFLEHPEWRGGLIDLGTSDTGADTAARVVAKVLSGDAEPCIALRGARQYFEQIVPAPFDAVPPGRFRDDGAYIVTGGLGGLGLTTARWLVDRGARHLILLGRRVVPEPGDRKDMPGDHPMRDVLNQIAELEAAGARVETQTLDVRNHAEMEALFSRLDTHGIAVRGVVHAAGVNWFGKILTLNVPDLLETLKTKVGASWHLHRLTQDRDLDCFVMFSSVSALWGSVDLAHYSAANRFMDALSVERARRGLPTLCIDWGPWDTVGMSAGPEEKTVLEKLGFSLLPPARALAAMDAALAAGRPLSLIAQVDWSRFQMFIDFSPQPSLFAQVATDPTRVQSDRSDHLQLILDAPRAEARAKIERVVRLELASVTLIESCDTLDPDQRFNFMGIDSLMALSLAAALENYFRFEVPSTLTYNYPTINAVTDYIADMLFDDTTEPTKNVQTLTPKSEIMTAPICAADWFQDPVGRGDTDATPLVYAFPYAGSGASAFTPLAQQLGGQACLVAVQTPGRETHGAAKPFERMADLVAGFLAVFEPPETPFAFFGHSMGAITAYAIAAEMHTRGDRGPSMLILSGANPPAGPPDRPIHTLPADAFIAEVARKYTGSTEESEATSGRIAALNRSQTLLRADITVIETCPKLDTVLDCPISVIAAGQDPLITRAAMAGWANHTSGDFSLAAPDGAHRIVTDAPDVLAAIILRAIKSLQLTAKES